MRLFWPTVDMLVEAPAVVASPAVCLNPSWFPSLGAPPSGTTTLDTETLEGDGIRGRGVVFQQALGELEIAVFTFDAGTLLGDVTLRGTRPAALLFHGAVRIRAHIDARLAGARRQGPGLAATPGAGGGFGGRGGAPEGDSRGGPDYGLAAAFEIGSGGQRGAAPGGLGGGGLQLGALGSLELHGARIDAGGETGAPSKAGVAGGGGSGGTVILHGGHVRLDPDTSISVCGGDGGHGNCAALGAGGGGGGYVLGASEPTGLFDPNGARFLMQGGRGGRSGSPSREGDGGRDGGPGVVYLAAKRGSWSRASRGQAPRREPFLPVPTAATPSPQQP